ncbi:MULTISPECIES: nucleotidyltransferase domain-containing protein [unclassified Luteococcus]|uniref:nucleotidyltransferase domain-containing protein n=1 Tax=unclassified Luteococcus TaxID=2639923 RepID=UPI00313B76E2
MTELSTVAAECDEAVRVARARLVHAVRQASREGMSQREIARQIHRSQPEVSRILRFHGTTPLAKRLIHARGAIMEVVREAGGSGVRVFGSVATGRDTQGSDVDLLFDMRQPLGLIRLGELERRIAEAVGADVDLVPIQSLRPDLRHRILGEAIPL